MITWTGEVAWGAPVQVHYAVVVDAGVQDGTGLQPVVTISHGGTALTRTVVTTVDAIPPLVEATRPGDGATGVPLTATIGITFSEPIDTAAFVYACTPDPGGWGVTWQGGNAQVELEHAALAAGQAITCAVVAAPDQAGNPLSAGGAPNPWSFTTGTIRHHVYLPVVLKQHLGP